MTGALIMIALLLATGVVLKLTHRPDPPSAPAPEAPAEECCGMHITCERDSLLAGVSKEIEYFDDEELDAFRGRLPHSYSPAETELFRDVLLTLIPDDIAPWSRSLTLRGIELPADLRDELIMIVSEARAQRANAHAAS